MKSIKKMVVPTDFSPCANNAAVQAIAFAEKCGAAIDLVHVTLLYEYDPNNPNRVFPDVDKAKAKKEILAKPEAHVGERMDSALEAHAESGVTINKVQVRGITEASAMLDYLKEHPADLVVMGTHGRRGFKRWLLGSVAEELIRFAPCPVVTIKENWSGNLADMKTILVPIDFSLASKSALLRAHYLADLFGASLHLLHVIQQPAYPDIYGDAESQTELFYKDAEAKARRIMESLLRENQATAPAEVHVRRGHPSKEILSFTEEKGVDMIVIAHLGLSRMPERIMGSVAEHVTRAAACPVFTADKGHED